MGEEQKRSLRPFDGAPLTSDNMYSHLPYVKDINLCTPEMVRLQSGNLIKYYSIDNAEAVTVDSNELADQFVQAEYNNIIMKQSEAFAARMAEEDAEGVADDLAAKLIEDIGDLPEETAETVQPEEEEVITNAFEGYDSDDDDEYDFSFLKAK